MLRTRRNNMKHTRLCLHSQLVLTPTHQCAIVLERVSETFFELLFWQHEKWKNDKHFAKNCDTNVNRKEWKKKKTQFQARGDVAGIRKQGNSERLPTVKSRRRFASTVLHSCYTHNILQRKNIVKLLWCFHSTIKLKENNKYHPASS